MKEDVGIPSSNQKVPNARSPPDGGREVEGDSRSSRNKNVRRKQITVEGDEGGETNQFVDAERQLPSRHETVWGSTIVIFLR
jgi:hypothetical protein